MLTIIKKDTLEPCMGGLFQKESFIGSDADFRFYTGSPNYNSFIELFKLFNYLSPACEHLAYHGTTTAPITSEHQIKCGSRD